jgi:glycosyltransferase involved in cell wall biosynthesis
MLNAEKAAASYKPRANDAPQETFMARLKVCETCPQRAGLGCVAGQSIALCTVLARNRDGHCPAHRWPGDPQPTAVGLPGPKADGRFMRRALERAATLVRRFALQNCSAKVKPAESVSIIIAARNYDRFLPEAIESALAQTVPCQVIYSDDGSSDRSVIRAQDYLNRGLEIVTGRNEGPAAARARGCAIARGDWLLCVDGDDQLPPRYVESMLAAATPDCPFVYGDAQAFGEHNTLWRAAGPDTSLWVRNYVNTSALYRRGAYHAAGGWQDGIGTMWDWDLALRASRFGRPARQHRTPLLYRQHAASFSHQVQEHDEAIAVLAREKVRRRLARLSVGTIVSGRLLERFEEWLDALAVSVRRLERPVDLVIVNHSDSALMNFVNEIAQERYPVFSSVRVVPAGPRLAFENEEERRGLTAKFLAAQCNRLRNLLCGDLHWIVEDDVFVPIDAAEKLLAAVTAGAVPPEAVTGLYLNRHVPDRIVGGLWRNGAAHELEAAPFQAALCRRQNLDLCGTGCLMYWRDRTPDFTSHLGAIPAHDWAWSMAIKRAGGQLVLMPEVRCGHAVNETETLWA